MDIRIAADDAKVGFVFARRGIVPEAASSWFLTRAVGISRALEWVATGRVFPATEGLEAGLFRSVHGRDEVLAVAHGIAREGVTSFLEKRPPVFPMKVSDAMPDWFPWWTPRQYD